MSDEDPHDLQRFVSAQEHAYETALKELRRGRKTSHWIWYIFPQVAGLGFSPTSQQYAIQSRAEGLAYLEHELLGPRLKECTQALLNLGSRRITDVMGKPDDLKLKSSMTLFAEISDAPIFEQVLKRFYGDRRDDLTLEFLKSEAGN
ncbi:MAG: DUF1810 domain-containing protein [Limisphaerales bacterium]